jgi:hypothetical protein
MKIILALTILVGLAQSNWEENKLDVDGKCLVLDTQDPQSAVVCPGRCSRVVFVNQLFHEYEPQNEFFLPTLEMTYAIGKADPSTWADYRANSLCLPVNENGTEKLKVVALDINYYIKSELTIQGQTELEEIRKLMAATGESNIDKEIERALTLNTRQAELVHHLKEKAALQKEIEKRQNELEQSEKNIKLIEEKIAEAAPLEVKETDPKSIPEYYRKEIKPIEELYRKELQVQKLLI